MTLLYGVGQALFVALSSRIVGMTLLWSILLLGVLLLVGLVWGGAEVITDRVPPEWTWLKASFATGPAAGLLTWILLTLFVDAVGVEDLGSALIGRASFTVLLVLASAGLGSRLGWLSLRRSDDPRADRDPGADTDEPIDDADRATMQSSTPTGNAGAAPELPSSTAERVAARRARRRREQAAASGDAPASPGARPSRPARSGDRGDDPTRVPFGGGPFAAPPSTGPSSEGASGGYSSPVVAVLPPVTPLPPSSETSSGSEDSEHSRGSHDEGEDTGARRPGGSRRRFGLHRPDDDG
jgi:hypothetical protein